LYSKCGSSSDRPFGTYTDITRTPLQVTEIALASGGCSASGKEGTPAKPTGSASSARGNPASGLLVSCRQTTSGRVSRSQASSRGNRALTELTFQVTNRTGG